MRLPCFFIKHPVITLVLNALIFGIGCLCLNKLPLREYPALSFPTITVTAELPNASAEIIEHSVTNVLEPQFGIK